MFKVLAYERDVMDYPALRRLKKLSVRVEQTSKATLATTTASAPVPTTPVETKTPTAAGYQFTYQEVDGAYGYNVYRGTVPNRPDLAEQVAFEAGQPGDPSPRGRQFDDAVVGTYYYWVAPVNKGGTESERVLMG